MKLTSYLRIAKSSVHQAGKIKMIKVLYIVQTFYAWDQEKRVAKL